MKHPSPRFACGSKEFYPPFPFPPGESRGGDGSPHGANGAPPPARGISKRSAKTSPSQARGHVPIQGFFMIPVTPTGLLMEAPTVRERWRSHGNLRRTAP